MTAAVGDSQGLVPHLCRSFLLATGWRLEYRPRRAQYDQTSSFETTLGLRQRMLPVTDGQQIVGHVLIAGAETPHPAVSLPRAMELAGALAEVLGTLAASTLRLNSRNDELSTLVNLGLAVPAQDNLAWALSQVLKAAVQLTSTRGATFFLLDPDLSRLKLRAVYQTSVRDVPKTARELDESPHDIDALTSGYTVVQNPEGVSHDWLPNSIRTAMCIAVKSETMPIGTLWVYDRRVRQFSDRDRHVLLSIASQIAAVLERVALLQSSDTQDRISRELQHASESERTLISNDLPVDPRFEVAARCASCYELGGDMCEVLGISSDRYVLAVGDATGNSIPAAMIMSAARGAIRAFPGDRDDVLITMGRLNNALCSITQSHQFMSMCYGVLDMAAKEFVYCNAGHPNPLLVRDGQVYLLESHGLLLGVLTDASYQTSTLQLEAGDLLVLYSDGISEARSGTQKMFRADGIIASVLRYQAGAARQVLEGIWQDVEQHIAEGPAGDDRTLLILRVL